MCDDLKLYEQYRDYIKHEDDLINHRLAWALAIQGFLFAAYALVLSKLIDVEKSMANSVQAPETPALHGQALVFLISLCFIGITICACAFVSIRAAENAVRGAKATYEGMKPVSGEDDLYFYQIRQEPPVRLPRLTGGGAGSAESRGGRLASLIPVVLGVVWAISLVATSYAPFRMLAGMVGATCSAPTSGPAPIRP